MWSAKHRKLPQVIIRSHIVTGEFESHIAFFIQFFTERNIYTNISSSNQQTISKNSSQSNTIVINQLAIAQCLHAHCTLEGNPVCEVTT